MLSVESAGLVSLAGVCRTKSSAVAATAAKASPATSFQPSAAAVATVGTEASATAAVLSGRLTATATHLSAAAAGYTGHEADSAAALAKLPVTG